MKNEKLHQKLIDTIVLNDYETFAKTLKQLPDMSEIRETRKTKVRGLNLLMIAIIYNRIQFAQALLPTVNERT